MLYIWVIVPSFLGGSNFWFLGYPQRNIRTLYPSQSASQQQKKSSETPGTFESNILTSMASWWVLSKFVWWWAHVSLLVPFWSTRGGCPRGEKNPETEISCHSSFVGNAVPCWWKKLLHQRDKISFKYWEKLENIYLKSTWFQNIFSKSIISSCLGQVAVVCSSQGQRNGFPGQPGAVIEMNWMSCAIGGFPGNLSWKYTR